MSQHRKGGEKEGGTYLGGEGVTTRVVDSAGHGVAMQGCRPWGVILVR